jgi:hypothetical protein
VLTERRLPIVVRDETRTLSMGTRIVLDDPIHLIVEARPVVVVEREAVDSVEVTETVGKDVSTRVEERSAERERWERPWEGEVRVVVGEKTLATAQTEDGVARLDLRVDSWMTTAEIRAANVVVPLDLTSTTHLASWLGRRITEALSDGDLGAARKTRALARGTAAAPAVEQVWCRAAVGPARLAAARDDLSRFVDLLAEVGKDGECRALRSAAGEVAEIQAGLAWSSGDRDAWRNWATALRAAGEIERADRVETTGR